MLALFNAFFFPFFSATDAAEPDTTTEATMPAPVKGATPRQITPAIRTHQETAEPIRDASQGMILLNLRPQRPVLQAKIKLVSAQTSLQPKRQDYISLVFDIECGLASARIQQSIDLADNAEPSTPVVIAGEDAWLAMLAGNKLTVEDMNSQTVKVMQGMLLQHRDAERRVTQRRLEQFGFA